MLRRSIWVVFCLGIFSTHSFADQLGDEKSRAKQILKIVIGDIEKNYYDPTLKGKDLRGMQAKANDMIDAAPTVGQVYSVIYGLVDSLEDSHTRFLPPNRTVRPVFGFDAKPYGDEVRIYRIKKGGPAEQAGLKVGDRIVQINGFDVERKSYDEMNIFFRILQPVRELEILVLRGKEAPKKFVVPAQVKPAQIVWENTSTNLYDLLMEYENVSDERESRFRPAEGNSGIGYLWLKTFTVEPESAANLASLAGKARALVIDLRGNRGGRRDTLIAFSNKFIAAPDVMGEEIGRKKTEKLELSPARGAYNVPMAILVDSQTSSSAEFFAKHFQRTKKAIVIGDTTAGRAVWSRFWGERIGVERFVPFGVQISVARMVFPDGDEIEGKGVIPDQKCVPTEADLVEGDDICYAMAKLYLEKQMASLPTNAAK
jgi:C-terminal processing protease CtpA/Prc